METVVSQPVIGQDDPTRLPPNGLEHTPSEYMALILQSLQTMKDGDFSVRLPVSWTGLPGKIADNFNEIVTTNEQMARELKRVGLAVGKEGRTRERIRIRAAPRRLGRHGDLGQYAGRGLAPADDRGNARHRRRGPGQSHRRRSGSMSTAALSKANSSAPRTS